MPVNAVEGAFFKRIKMYMSAILETGFTAVELVKN